MAAASGDAPDGAQYDYDLFCIGAGSGGVRASRMSASFGARVAVAELPFATKASDMAGGAGGTCVIRGCVPKKLLVCVRARSTHTTAHLSASLPRLNLALNLTLNVPESNSYGSHYAEDFKDAAGFGWSLPGGAPTLDWPALIAAKNTEITRLTGVYGRILSGAGVTVLEGRGRLIDAHTVELATPTGATQRFTAANILVATGGRAHVPTLPGSELVLTSDDALELPACPKRIAIVGAGYIGLEFAGIFNAMGADVHVFFRGDAPLRGFDSEVRKHLAEQLAAKGITLHANVSPVGVEATASGGRILRTDDGAALECDAVMFATGRLPNVRNLGLEALGIAQAGNGAIKVDAFSRTNVPSVWAVGDVTDRINLTPVALMEGMALAKTLFKNDPTTPDYDGVPAAVFSQPPIGTVGLTEEAAVAQYGNVDVFSTSFKPMKNTLSGRNEKMLMKLVVDAATDKVLGVHVVGPDAPEMLQGFAVALKCGATKAQFDATVGLHPTAAEELVTMRSGACVRTRARV
jgi:glutathione reductase (NADPH)